MSKPVPYLAALPLSTFFISLSAHADTHTPDAVTGALADPRRPAEQIGLNAARKPAQLIVFSQLKRGDRVADFIPGNGYLTHIMSNVVGLERRGSKL
jgi:predicted methyltransferase